ncbi:MAG: ABC transporter ATP-binding protein [Bacillota bacterium]
MEPQETVKKQMSQWGLCRRLMRYLKPFRLMFAFTILLFVVCVIMWHLEPYFDEIIVDKYIALKKIDGLLLVILLSFGIHMVNFLGFVARQLMLAIMGQRILADMRQELFDHIQTLSVRFHEEEHVGRIMTRFLNDMNALHEFLTHILALVAHELTSFSMVLAIMFFIDRKLALAAMITLPVLIILSIYLRPKIHGGWKIIRNYISSFNAFLAENISGIRTIQAFVREDENMRQFIHANSRLVKSWLKTARLQAAFVPAIEMTRAFGLALVLYASAGDIKTGLMTVGIMLAFTGYINRLWAPIGSISGIYMQYQAAMTAAEKVFTFLDTKPEITDAPDAIEMPVIRGQIDFDHVSFGYDPDNYVLRDINLHIKPGQTIALVGATGCGKTSLTNLVLRFYDPQEGGISIDGYDLRRVRQESLRRQTGTVLQDPFIFCGTIFDNIKYARPEALPTEVIAAAKAVNAHKFIEELADGYQTVIYERGSGLSLGQRQLISFARALLADPKILILDEATASIDSQTETAIQKGLANLLKGRTSLVVAHRLSTIRNADLIVIMDSGRIVEMGTHEQLLEAPDGKYAALYKAQFGSVA